MDRRLRRLGLLAAAALALAACGGGGQGSDASLPGDTQAGAQVFTEAGCTGCHALRAAGSSGGTGPDLDTLRPGYEQIMRQVENGGRGMPSFRLQLSREQMRDVAAFVAESTGGGLDGAPVAGDFQPDDTTLESCDGDFTCLEQGYGNLAYNEGPEAALERFEQEIVESGPVESDCHRIAHSIGAASLARFEGEVGQAFAAGSAACWSGYYHGVIERAFVDVEEDELAPAARRMCSDPGLRTGPTFTLYQCVHGLGHGLMIYTRYDLPRSLETCDRLEGSWDQTACTGGVFMENISSSYGVKSKWLRDDDLLYPCKTVAERHKLYCYLMVTSRILPAVGYDFGKTSELCRTSEPGWVETCFQSLGRDASGQTRQDPDGILRHCRTAGDMMVECVWGAVRDMASNYAGGREASELCEKAPAAMRARCFEGIGTILGDLHQAAAEIQAACAEITRRYRAECARGAGI
jgi:mono/diheme cytochrome c family protein